MIKLNEDILRQLKVTLEEQPNEKVLRLVADEFLKVADKGYIQPGFSIEENLQVEELMYGMVSFLRLVADNG